MRMLLIVFGVYMAAAGALLIARPSIVSRSADWWVKRLEVRAWALLVLALGALILWAAPASRAPIFIRVLGGLSIAKGLYLLLAPRAQLGRFVARWTGLPADVYRLWGLAAAVIGGLLIATL